MSMRQQQSESPLSVTVKFLPLALETYKIKNDKIIKIKKSKLNLKNIEKRVRGGEKFSSKIVASMFYEIPLNRKNLNRYSHIAQFLQKNRQYRASIVIFRSIVAQFPKRAVALLNYADSLWGIHDKSSAIEYYTNYIRAMLKKDKLNKIPKRVFLRIK